MLLNQFITTFKTHYANLEKSFNLMTSKNDNILNSKPRDLHGKSKSSIRLITHFEKMKPLLKRKVNDYRRSK